MKHLLAPLLLVLCACAATPVVTGGPTADEAAANRARPYVEGLAHLEDYDVEGVLESLLELQEMVSSFHSLRMVRHEAEARERHTSLAFDFAAEALSRGDLDEADQAYRGLVDFYVGAAYAGIRDRALVGIEDVRHARP